MTILIRTEKKYNMCYFASYKTREIDEREKEKKSKTTTDYLHAWSATLAHARFLLYTWITAQKGDKSYL